MEITDEIEGIRLINSLASWVMGLRILGTVALLMLIIHVTVDVFFHN